MITGNDFIQLSNRWAMLKDGSGGGEAVWRTSICRAYYGAFHLGQQCLTTIGIRVPDHNAHVFVFEALQQSGNRELIKAGRMLAELRDCRVDADYDLAITAYGDQNLAQECHYNALMIDSLLRAGITGNRNEMKAAIVKWGRDIKKCRGSARHVRHPVSSPSWSRKSARVLNGAIDFIPCRWCLLLRMKSQL